MRERERKEICMREIERRHDKKEIESNMKEKEHVWEGGKRGNLHIWEAEACKKWERGGEIEKERNWWKSESKTKIKKVRKE